MMDDATVSGRVPIVWLVMGYRAGENAQILALGEGLGWPFEVKRLSHRRWYFLASVSRSASAFGVDLSRSSPLRPPWPDVVISAGFRNEPVCRWIKRMAAGKTRLVHIGRPWASFRHFDLVVTTPQYRLPGHPHVLHNTTTMTRVNDARLASAAAELEPRLAHLPKPRVAVIVGGHSGPYSFDRPAGARLGREASALAAAAGGSLLVSTSSRTPKVSVDAFERAVTCPADIYRWKPSDRENPYFGYLALAESIIVTGDSVAMLSDACATGKPVYIFDLGGMRAPSNSGAGLAALPSKWNPREPGHIKAVFYRLLMRFGPRRLSRDLRCVFGELIEAGQAVWLGERFSLDKRAPLDDMSRTVARVKALWDPAARRVSEGGVRITSEP